MTGACLEKVKRYLGVRIEGVNHKQDRLRIPKSYFPPEESKSKILRGLLWGHRISDVPSSFALGLRPMPRPIITCKKDNGDHGNPKAAPRTTSSSASLGRGRRGAIHQQIQSSKASQKKRQVQQVSRLKHGGKTIPGKTAASPLNAPQLIL